jgi:hypothetical protein
MKRSLPTSLAIAVMFVGLSCADAFARQNVRKPAESGGVTGTYKLRSDELKFVASLMVTND